MRSAAALAALVAVTPTVAAHRLLLTSGDFPSGWTSKPAAQTHPVLTCTTPAPKERAVASSPRFAASNTGPYVTQTVWVYRSDAQATTAWKRAAPQLRSCLVNAIKRGSTQTVTFTVKHTAVLTLPKLAPRVVGYRVTAKAASPGQTVGTYYDMIVLARGTAITELSFAQLTTPVSRSLELRLARLTAKRLVDAGS